MKTLRVKKSINIFACIFLLILISVALVIVFTDYTVLANMGIFIIVGFIVSVVTLISELRKILSKEEIVNISEEGIKCVDYPSQTIAFIK